jgi:hypothetical protein
MRKTMFRLLAAGLAAGIAGPAIAQSCLPAAERQAFDVRAVQSQLQVAALLCRDQGYPQLETEYRAFVQKFSPEFQGPARNIQAHFRRTAGRDPRALDAYITNLANAHQQDASRSGTQFCAVAAPMFRAAMAQSSASDLAQFAVERNILNLVDTPACAERAATPAAARQPAARSQPSRPQPARQPARPAASNRSAAVTR